MRNEDLQGDVWVLPEKSVDRLKSYRENSVRQTAICDNGVWICAEIERVSSQVCRLSGSVDADELFFF